MLPISVILDGSTRIRWWLFYRSRMYKLLLLLWFYTRFFDPACGILCFGFIRTIHWIVLRQRGEYCGWSCCWWFVVGGHYIAPEEELKLELGL